MVYSPISFLYFQILCNFKLNTSLNSIIPYLLKSLIAEGKDYWRYTSYFSIPWALKADRTSIWFIHVLLSNYLRPNVLTCKWQHSVSAFLSDLLQQLHEITYVRHLSKFIVLSTPTSARTVDDSTTQSHTPYYHSFLRKYLQGVVSGVVGVGSSK